jgi:hypothetical protein
MSEADDIAFFVRMIATQVRSMSLHDGVRFLRGILAVAGTHPAFDKLRETYHELASADDQLEVLGGQLKLNLGSNGHDGKDHQ